MRINVESTIPGVPGFQKEVDDEHEVERDLKRFVAVFQNGDCVAFNEDGVSNFLDFREHLEPYSMFYNDAGILKPCVPGPINWGSDADNPNVAIRGSGELLVDGKIVGNVTYNEH